jgi:hypothetical protein
MWREATGRQRHDRGGPTASSLTRTTTPALLVVREDEGVAFSPGDRARDGTPREKRVRAAVNALRARNGELETENAALRADPKAANDELLRRLSELEALVRR